MLAVTKKLKRRRLEEVPVVWKIILCGLLLLAYILGSLGGLGRIDFALTDQLSLLNGRKASANIVIIGIDDKSIAELGRWPWRRDIHTRLLKRLATAQTRSIGMQIIFSEPDGSRPQDDLSLAKQVAATGNVVLPVIMQSIPGKPPAQSLPLPALIKAARAIGHTHLELDSDGLARSVFLREGVNRYQWDHFSLAMYKIAGGAYPDKQLPGARASEDGAHVRHSDAWQRDYWIQIPYTRRRRRCRLPLVIHSPSTRRSKKPMKKQINWTLLSLACAAANLTGCTSTVSKGIDDQGQAAEVIFPRVEDAWLKEGTFVNLDNLRAVHPGTTKDQLYDLLGRPHFAEGMYGVREWDYIFNFRKAGDEVVRCQYKVLFDKDALARHFHWKPSGCADYLTVKPATPVIVEKIVEKIIEKPTPSPIALVPEIRKEQLQSEGLFAFGKSSINDLLPPGRQQLAALANTLRNSESIDQLTVTGHTDRIGSESSNDTLSLARAVTVRDFLVQATGMPPQRAYARGRGEHDPLVQCNMPKREALVACLAPNRRVEVEALVNKRP